MCITERVLWRLKMSWFRARHILIYVPANNVNIERTFQFKLEYSLARVTKNVDSLKNYK